MGLAMRTFQNWRTRDSRMWMWGSMSLKSLLPLHRTAMGPRSLAASSRTQSYRTKSSASGPTKETVPDGPVATQTQALSGDEEDGLPVNEQLLQWSVSL
ncbi:hypothetical protein P4O66_002305 [Electrophorus voltai]|uniref:Uncharacterized protein n=1 Tax=Electrophorus voltai TaxID=2609070 RepID=A0AAD9DP48_9TELE|nr:hypothetical protein P4O66_002305 [Electrophorus voltai]